jgi:hypothetical protein
MRRTDQCETCARALERLTQHAENACMPLYRATALIAVMLIVLLSAGYAAGEDVDDDPELSQAVSEDSPS